MTIFFQSHQITIKRFKNRGGIIFASSATFTAAMADIQPASSNRINETGGRIGKTYVGFVDVLVDVKEGDKVVASGKTYMVKGVSIWSGANLLDHKELSLESQD